jgi:hypothetical protein
MSNPETHLFLKFLAVIIEIEIFRNYPKMIFLLKGFNLWRFRRGSEADNEIINFNEEYKRGSF